MLQRLGRRRADDVRGIETIVRVEDPLDLTKDIVQWAVLALDPGGSGNPGAVLRADGSTHLEHKGIEGIGERAKFGRIGRVGWIEEGADMHLSRGGVRHE